jgi:hypothetical protein
MRDIEHLQEMLARKRRAFTRKYCLHPTAPLGCSRKIAAAHSVQRAILKQHIAIEGHVVQIKVSPQVDPVGLLVAPEKVGINDATTFFGFCSNHDAELFRPLERSGFSFEQDQIALLGYRSVCRELYQKQAEIATAEAARSYAIANPRIVGLQDKLDRDDLLRMARINAQINLANARDTYASMLQDASKLRYYALQFNAPPVYVCSVAFLPEWDFDGCRLQDLGSIEEFKPLCFSAWAAGDNAVAVFCWHESADAICRQFINSLRRIPRDRIANRILSMALDVSENVVFREDWWETMSEPDRQRIVSKALSGVGSFDRKSDSLSEDGLCALSCEIDVELINYGSESAANS